MLIKSTLKTLAPVFALTFLITNCKSAAVGNGGEGKGQVNQTQPLVRFNTNGTLKMVQFTDLHYGEQPNLPVGPEDDKNTTRVIADILEWEDPDFVVFTGDLVTGDFMAANRAPDYIHMMLKPVVEKGYRWASVYGNHDTGPLVSRLEILRTEQSYGELCYTKRETPETLPGVTNYYIPIYAPVAENATQDEDEHPVMLWWFLDSQGGYTLGGRQPFYIDQSVVYWFGNESQRLQNQWGVLPSLVFFHIPSVEYVAVQDGILNNPLCSGLVDDVVTPQESDTGIMNALLKAGGVRTIFVGHEHGNSWCCFWQSIEICYNRHTGYGGYGEWTRGARTIVLDLTNEGINQTNFVRLETGEIADEFPAS